MSYDSINNWYLTLYGHVQQHLGMALIIKLNRTVFISLSKSKNDSLVFNYSGCTVYHDVQIVVSREWYWSICLNASFDKFNFLVVPIDLLFNLLYPPLKIVESTTLTSTKQSMRLTTNNNYIQTNKNSSKKQIQTYNNSSIKQTQNIRI